MDFAEKNQTTQKKSYKQDYAYNRLKHAIITGEFPPEKLLVERELCEMLQISRTPVREALRCLASEGLVSSHPGRGMFVTRITPQEIIYIYELKEALERMAVRLCIERMTDDQLGQLGQCLEGHTRAYEEEQYELAADMDMQFHVMLVEFAQSPKIEEHAKAILLQTRRLSQLSVYNTSFTMKFINEHKMIYDAMLNRNPFEAEQAVHQHILTISKFQKQFRKQHL